MTEPHSGPAAKLLPRVTYVLGYPPDARDSDRFGMNLLVSEGYEVRTWMIGGFFYEDLDKLGIAPPEEMEISACDQPKVWHAMCHELEADDVVILVGVPLAPRTRQQWHVLNALLKSKSVICTVTSGSLPTRSGNALFRDRVRKAASKLVPTAKKGAGASSTTFFEALSAQVVALGLRLRLLRPQRPLDIIWAGVSVDSVPSYWIGSKTRLEYIHTFDYDLFLANRSIKHTNRSRLVFIDCMGPSHPDYLAHGHVPEMTMEDYSRLICRALDRIETQSGHAVTIAAHPRAARGTLEGWYGNRNVRYGETPRLIAESDACLVAEGSTAIGLAVAFSKPIVLLASHRYEEYIVELNEDFERILGCMSLDIDDSEFTFEIRPINRQRYADYLATYIKRPSTPEKPFWRVVSDELAAL